MEFPFSSLDQLKSVHARIKPGIHKTPVMVSASFNKRAENQTWFKCENFQRTGSFKFRGALSAVDSLSDTERQKGVATHSSGNFAQAVALAANLSHLTARIVMPENAPEIKKAAVRSYMGIITECPPGLQNREKALLTIKEKFGCTELHPSNQIEVIEGNGTISLEFLEEIPELEAIITPVGGGGLLAGTALAAKQINPDIRIFAGEPANADDAFKSLHSGVIQPSINPETIADGLKTQLGDVNFPIIIEYVEDILRVEEEEIIEAMKFIWQRMKIIIEPSSAVPVAAVLKHPEIFGGMKTGIILSGGNVQLDQLPF